MRTPRQNKFGGVFDEHSVLFTFMTIAFVFTVVFTVIALVFP